MAAVRTRDTDADWRRIGSTEPFWGVSSHPQYLHDQLDAPALEALYASGRLYVDAIAADVAQDLGVSLQAAKALDFGCGVGRLSEAMGAYAKDVTGYDVSAGMLEVARRRGAAVRYVDTLPDETFDWINSALVFQHIPPERGLVALEALLQRLSPDGIVSLQFTLWREPHLSPAAPTLVRRLKPAQPPTGSVMMYDYALNDIVQRLEAAGVKRLALHTTRHGGHHGAMIIGRRAEPLNAARY